MTDGAVLVLNLNYEPLNVCNMRRALALLTVGRAQILENGRGVIRTPSVILPKPSVIRLTHLVQRPRPQVKLTRREVFRRDGYTCQYCGRQSHHLTVDHVVPRHLGGGHDWENVVSACPVCNRHKGGRTPTQAEMALVRQPFRPKPTLFYLFEPYLAEHLQWHKFIAGWT